MEGAGGLPARGSRGTTLRYEHCRPSRNHVSLEIKDLGHHFTQFYSEGENTHMPLVSMRQLLDEAAKGGYGVGAFNVNNMEQIQSIMEAARETKSPVIVQASRGARQFAEDLYLFRLIQAAAELNPDIPIAMHQDHGNNEATCATAIQYGFSSVMMDGSLKADGKTPSDYDYNVGTTRRAPRGNAAARLMDKLRLSSPSLSVAVCRRRTYNRSAKSSASV